MPLNGFEDVYGSAVSRNNESMYSYLIIGSVLILIVHVSVIRETSLGFM